MFRVEYFYRCVDGKIDIVGCEMLSDNTIPNNVLFAASNPKQDWFLFNKAISAHKEFIPKYLMNKPEFGWTVNASPRCIIDNIEAFSALNVPKMFVEITEREKITQAEIKKLKPFSSMFIIDDFGCENTNIGLIRSLRPYGVKIDRVFWDTGPEFISELIKELKKHSTIIIGEKVESEKEYELMRSVGINIVQGYYMYNFENEILEYNKNAQAISL